MASEKSNVLGGSNGFAECAGCGRHVRAAETRCPFCRGKTLGAARRIAETVGVRPSRAALLVSAALTAGCGSGTSISTFYGAPAYFDAGDSDDGAAPVGAEDAGGAGDAGSSGGGIAQPAYGAPVRGG